MLSPCSAAVASQDISKRLDIVLRHRTAVSHTTNSVGQVAVDGHCHRSGKTDQQRSVKTAYFVWVQDHRPSLPSVPLTISMDTLYHPAECRCVVRGCAMLSALSLVAGRRRRE